MSQRFKTVDKDDYPGPGTYYRFSEFGILANKKKKKDGTNTSRGEESKSVNYGDTKSERRSQRQKSVNYEDKKNERSEGEVKYEKPPAEYEKENTNNAYNSGRANDSGNNENKNNANNADSANYGNDFENNDVQPADKKSKQSEDDYQFD